MTISFNSIPISLRVPGQYVEFDNSKAIVGLPVMPNKILVIGQMLGTGTAVAAVPVQVTSADQAALLFGRGSMLALMFATLKANNPLTETWALPLIDNGAGAAAAGSILVTAVPTVNGTLNLYIGGRLVQVPVLTTQTTAQIATAINTAINADLDGWVTSTVSTSTVTVTARHKGDHGNYIDMRTSYYPGDAPPAGFAATLTQLSAGASNPILTAGITALGDEWYNHWVLPYVDGTSTTAVTTELDRRFGPTIMKEGHAWLGAAGTFGVLAALGTGLNTHELSIIGATKSPSPPALWAAALAGVAAYYGNIDPARPLQTLPLIGILAPAIADRSTFTDRNILLQDGISTYTVDPSGVVNLERVITCFRLNAFGLPDTSYLDAETMLTLFFLRYSVRSRIAQRFPRYKLADDGTPFGAGQAIVTPKVIKGELIALASQWADAGLVEDLPGFKANLIVEREPTDPNRINALIPPNVVNQFRVFAGKVQFVL